MRMRWNNTTHWLVIRDWRLAIALPALVLCGSYGPAKAGHYVQRPAQQYTFDEVASGLKHPDPATRLRAIEILRDADYAEAAAPIAGVLGDSDDRVQLAALDAERALFTSRPVSRRRKIGFVVEVRSIAGGDAAAEGQLALKVRRIPPEVLTGLAVALRDNNPRVRGGAIELAALLAPHKCRTSTEGSAELCGRVGDALVHNINAREPLLRRAAMQTLGVVRYANAAQALSDQLSFYQTGPDALAALEGLAGIGSPASTTIFQRLLTSSNADMRRLAVEGLARAGAREALTELQRIAQTERTNGVLLALHYANLKLGEPSGHLPALVTALRTPAQRSLGLKYLLDLADSMAPAIAESLRDESADVRRLVADVIGFSRESSVLAALEALRSDTDPDVAAAAQQAIQRINLDRGTGAASAR
jgi:HEAT repeat protein